MRYRSHVPNPALIAPIGLTVEPGQEFDSLLDGEPFGLNHPELIPLDDEAKAFAAEIAAENEAHAAAYRARVGSPPPEGGTEEELEPGPGPARPDYRAALGLEPLPPVGEAGPATIVEQPKAKE